MNGWVQFFDGQRAQARRIRLAADDEGITLEDGATARVIPGHQVRIVQPVGSGPWVLELADGGRIECGADLGRAVLAVSGRQRDWARRLENAWPWAVGSLVGVVLVSVGLLRFGVPWMAERMAMVFPPHLESGLAERGMALLDRLYFDGTELAPEKVAEVHALFQDVLTRTGFDQPAQLEFRQGNAIGANALALPGGVIVITDELVQMAESEDEIAAVLAHEVGHLVHRHSLRLLLQNAAGAMIIASVTGDLASITALGSAIPSTLLHNSYSRTFESEADRFAFDYMELSGRDPMALSKLLERVEAFYGGDVPSILSTHPPSDERRPR